MLWSSKEACYNGLFGMNVYTLPYFFPSVQSLTQISKLTYHMEEVPYTFAIGLTAAAAFVAWIPR